MSTAVKTPGASPHVRRPSLFDRTLSTPPSSPAWTAYQRKASYPKDTRFVGPVPLTPPTSPRLTRSSTDLTAWPDSPTPASTDGWKDATVDETVLGQVRSRSLSDPSRAHLVVECPFDVEIARDHHGREQRFGSGAWSTVYRAIGRPKPIHTASPPTPPSSPVAVVPLLVAVKKPARRSAVSIIRSEGVLLSELAAIDGHEAYVVPFFGMVASLDALVLAPVPYSLEEHIRKCTAAAHQDHSTWTMSRPCLGQERTWLELADQTISGLAWLHSDAGVIHGDIKPGNILLSPNLNFDDAGFPFTALYADFSSGQLMDSADPTPNTLSAVTREYTAPELLSSKVLKDPTSTATTASDVFSLAVTLLVAATGELMVYPGSVWQRQAMATQGWLVLSHVRNGDQGTRVPQFGIVDQLLERAVLQAGMGRIDAVSWKSLVDEKMRGEPTQRAG